MKEDHRGRQSGSIAGKKQKRTKETSSQSLELLLFFPTETEFFPCLQLGFVRRMGYSEAEADAEMGLALAATCLSVRVRNSFI